MTCRPVVSNRDWSKRLRNSRSTPGPAVAVLLDRQHDPVPELLRVAEAVDEVVTGHHVVLVVEQQHRVGLVGQRGGAPQVPHPHPPAGGEALLVGGHHAQDRDVVVQGEVLEALGDRRDPLRLTDGLGGVHLLQVVDHDHRVLAGPPADLVDGGLDRLDARPGAGGAVQHEPVAVLLDDLDRLHAALGVAQPLLERARPTVCALEGAADPVDARRHDAAQLTGFQGHQAHQEGLEVVLEGEEDHRASGARDVARHLQHPGRLAQALRTAEEDQLTGAAAAVEGLVEQLEPRRPDARGRVGARGDLMVGLLQHLAQRLQ